MMRYRSTILVKALTPTSALTAVALTVLAAGCSNDSSKDAFGGTSPTGTGGTMSIVSCSLGCNTFQSSQVSCNVNDVFVNEEIRIEFSQAVDLSTVNQATFQVVETSTGVVPPGTFSKDPSNARGIIYRPLLTFDSSGSPVFGLQQGLSYEIFLPGSNLDSGPFITSTTGRPLGTRMRCIVTAGGGINDPVSGAPTVDVRVNVIETDGGGNPFPPPPAVPNFGALVPADGATDVHRQSDITFTFNDIMNPATLVNPVTGQSPSIRVFVDPDGNVADASDQVEVFGQFQLFIDQSQLMTRVQFDPDTEFPSAGPPSQVDPRRIVVELPSSIVDLGGNSIASANSLSFVPERLTFPLATLQEDFDTTPADPDHAEDLLRSGALWGAADLRPGFGGGSGRLGDLRLTPGEVLTLYTDGLRPKISPDGAGHEVDAMGTPQFVDQLFGPDALVHQTSILESDGPLPGDAGGMPASVPLTRDSQNVATVLLDNYVPAGPMATPTAGTSTFVVRDGIFEFASLTLEAGTVLRLVGSEVPRVYVRGAAIIRGRIEINGEEAGQGHLSQSDLGGLGGAAGPGGGAGGDGGLRPDGGGDLASIGGVANPLFTMESDSDGQPGGGYLFPSADPMNPDTEAGGGGGTRWPLVFPPTANPALDQFGGLIFSFPNNFCDTAQVGAPGGGGGRALDGGAGVAMGSGFPDPPGTVPPQTPGGSFPIGPADPARTLAPELGFLVGGGGGGGSGGHFRSSKATIVDFFNGICGAPMLVFFSHSGAGGGGGGGAIQIQAGARMTVDGVIDASGGRGGQPLATTSDPNLLTSLEATPGGSGAGGSILLQTLNLSPLGALAGRLNVRGGPVTNGIQSSTGGAGSMGLVRVEAGSTANGSVPSFDSVARSVSPVDTTNLPASSAWVSVEPNGWQRLLVMSIFNQPDPLTGVPLTFLPDALSGAQSCWLRPEGNFFRLTFQSDDPMTGDRGWDMKVVLAGVEVDYRAPGSFEDIFGSDVQDPNVLGLGAPFIVRFQGARAIKEIADVDLCTVPLTGPDSPIQPGSLTPWVLHPDELNTYWEDVFPASPGEVSKRKPNMIRYQIVFNRLPANFVGVDEVFIKMQPE